MRISVFLSVFLCLISCQNHSQKSISQAPSSSINLALATEPPTLDPNQATDNVSFQLLNQLQEGLTQFDEKLNVLPANAKKWDVLQKGQVYIFYLDPSYKWSDGKQVTAQDFKDSWLRLLHPKTAAPYAYFLYDIKGAKEFNEGKNTDPNSVKIEVINPLTLKVTLKKPVVYFPMITTFMVTYPIRTDILQKHPKYFSNPKHYVSNGSYTLTKWHHDYKLVLNKNLHYGGFPKPQISQATYFIVHEPIIQLSLYLRGDLDYVLLPPLAIQKYKDHADHVSMAKLRNYYYGFNMNKKPFDQFKWRQAFAMALDKTKLPKILMGEEIPTNSWIPQGMFANNQDIGLKFNPQKAKNLIQNDLQKKEFKDLKIELHFNSDPINKIIAEWAQAEWQQNLGLKVHLQNQEWKTYLSTMVNDPPQLYRLGWGADFPDPDNFMNLFTSFSGNNHTGWKNTDFDNLIDKASSETDLKKRKELYDTAQKLMLEDNAIMIPLFIQTTHYLVKKDIQPLPLNPLDFVYLKKIR